MKNRLILSVALIMALVFTGGSFAYTWASAGTTIGITEPIRDVASSNATPTQPDWESLLPVYGEWEYRKKITIDHTEVAASLTDFPVLISITDADLRDDAQNNGDDIKFTESDGTTKLDHEIERFDGNNGELVAWVRIPSLASDNDTEIYMYYGNADASNQENVTGVWDSSYEMVQHMVDSTTSTIEDSTSNDHDGTKLSANNPVEANGKIGRAQDFSSDHISCGDLGIGDNYTAECWIKADSLIGSGDQDTYGFTIMASAVSGQGYPLWLTARSTEIRIWAYESTASTGGWRETTGAGLNTTDHFHIAATAISGSTTIVYVNGVQRLSFTNDGDVPWTNIFTIGDLRPARAIYFDGIIEEVRISDTIRSAEWVETSYNNQDDPSDFCSVGIEEVLTPLCGEVPTGNLFTVTPDPGYSGDLVAKVYLTNTANLTRAYQYLNMKLYMAGSVEAGQTPSYSLLTLQNGEAAITLGELAGISETWTQTSQADFQNGNLTQVSVISPGDVVIESYSDNEIDTFDDETKISSSDNLTVSGGQVKLLAGGTPGSETFQPNAAGDDTSIYDEYPAWYSSSWSRRTPVTINNSGSALTDYQVSVNLTFDGDMQPDFDDIRFTDTDGSTLLSYWRESYVASTYAIFWVKIPSIPAGTKDIYVYYGNGAVSTTGDGDATFEFFDDFSGDLSKWNIHIDTDVAIVSGYGNPSPCLEISGGSTSSPYGFAVIGSDATYSGFQDGIIEADVYPSTNALPEIIFRGNYASNTGYKGRWDSRSGTETPWMKPPYSGWGAFGSSVTRFGIANQWQQAKLVINGSTFQIYNDGDLKSTVTDTQYAGPGEIGFANHYGSYARFDNVRVRKYAATEPTTGFGTEESQGGHWDKVDDITPDDFITYVSTNSTSYQRDLYNIPSHVTGSGKINNVTVYFRFSGDSNGGNYTGYARAAININGTLSEGDEQSQTGKTFVSSSYPWIASPDTGSDWTWDEIDALQIGVSLRSEGATSYAYCTQVYAVVNYTPYSSPGMLASINLLSGETVYTVDGFDCEAPAIPSGTGLKAQFSTDNTSWYDSAGILDSWDILSQGTNNLDLSGLGWLGPNFYYRMEFTSDGGDTPVLDEITVNFSTCYTSGNLVSSAYDTGSDSNWDWQTVYFTIDEPSGTDVVFQIRTAATEAGLDSATWYGPTGTSDNYTVSGTAINSVHDGDRWIQYKAYFTGPGDNTPDLSDISINYTLAITSYTIEVIGGGYCLVSRTTSDWDEGWAITPELYIDVTQR